VAEDWEGGGDEFHGTGGPLLTSRTSDKPALCHKIIEAGTEIGLEYHEDVNHLPPGAGDNIGWVQQTRRGRRRQSAARTYLRPAMKRPNLEIVTDALVHRVLFEGKRAVGVEFSRAGQVERADAAREVILSGGAIGSPHVLQLSGVGDPDHLGRIGVPVVHALPGVGKNLQDHFLARVTAEVTGIATANEKSRGMPFVGEIMRYVFAGTGLLTYAASLVAASVKVLEESATPDVQVLFANASFAPGPIRRLDDKPGMTGGMWQMRPLSRGYVEAKSPDPHQAPAINPRYLSEETDRRCAVGGLRAVRRLFAAPALAPYLVGEILPGTGVQSDDELLDYLRQTGSTVFHATCTCKMGRDPMAVVDDQLRVQGLDGLRVVDASVMPAVTSTNTNAPTIMIAEKGAAIIKAAARQRMAA
jgi:choline dehydrogenase